MNKMRFLACALSFSALMTTSFAATTQYVSNEILVKINAGSAPALLLSVTGMNATIKSSIPHINWHVIKLPAGKTPDAAIRQLRSASFIRATSKISYFKATNTPNDPLLGQQWQINRISLPTAWDFTVGDPNVVIAVLDTGVKLDHVDLQSKVLNTGYDFANDDTDPTDDNGHGTHVAGLCAAATNNGVGGAGTGRDSMIMPIKVLGAGGSGQWDWTANGIIWAADNGAKVINMSLGSTGAAQVVQDACDYARSQNVLVVAAAGNNGNTVKFYPAAYPGVLAVASSDPNDSRSGFSNYGTWVHIAGPGNNVLSTTIDGQYANFSGTSMACPVVAGVAGLVYARSGLDTPESEVAQLLMDTSDPVPGNYVISGRVNAFQAAQAAVVTATASFEPISATEFQGTVIAGGLSDLALPDGQLYTMLTEVVGRQGSLAGTELAFQLDRPIAELFKFKLNFRAKANRTSTGMIWFFNQNTQEWDFIKAFPVKSTLGSVQLKVQGQMGKYVDSAGQVFIRVRGHIASGRPGGSSPFIFSLDLAGMQADYEVTN